MKTFLKLIFVIFLTSCSNKAKQNLGIAQNIPDEMQVSKVKPLEVPPHFTHSRVINNLDKKE